MFKFIFTEWSNYILTFPCLIGSDRSDWLFDGSCLDLVFGFSTLERILLFCKTNIGNKRCIVVPVAVFLINCVDWYNYFFSWEQFYNNHGDPIWPITNCGHSPRGTVPNILASEIVINLLIDFKRLNVPFWLGLELIFSFFLLCSTVYSML